MGREEKEWGEEQRSEDREGKKKGSDEEVEVKGMAPEAKERKETNGGDEKTSRSVLSTSPLFFMLF